MSTVLSNARDLATNISGSAQQLISLAGECSAIQRQFDSLLTNGTPPASVKTQIDLLLVPVGASLDAIQAQLNNLGFKSVQRWQVGAPPGVGWLRSGYYNTTTLVVATGVAMDKRMILYNDVGPNINLFSGVKANDIIELKNSSGNDGAYTIKYDVYAKGDNTTYGVEAISGANWGKTGGWTAATGVYSEGSAIANSFTNTLAAMSATGAFTVQFDITWTSGAGTVTSTIGGDYSFSKAISASGHSGTYSFTSNASGATPVLTFAAAWTSGTFSFTISNVYVYGAPVLFVVEPFAVDVGAGNDTSAVITLAQTAA